MLKHEKLERNKLKYCPTTTHIASERLLFTEETFLISILFPVAPSISVSRAREDNLVDGGERDEVAA